MINPELERALLFSAARSSLTLALVLHSPDPSHISGVYISESLEDLARVVEDLAGLNKGVWMEICHDDATARVFTLRQSTGAVLRLHPPTRDEVERMLRMLMDERNPVNPGEMSVAVPVMAAGSQKWQTIEPPIAKPRVLPRVEKPGPVIEGPPITDQRKQEEARRFRPSFAIPYGMSKDTLLKHLRSRPEYAEILQKLDSMTDEEREKLLHGKWDLGQG